MNLNEKQRKFLKYLSLGIAIVLGLLITLLGGGVILVYIGLMVSFFILGWISKGILQVFKEYKLALKVNTVMYNSQESQKMKSEIDTLRAELKTAADRMTIYQAAAQQQKGGNYFDHFDSNRSSGLRQDSQAD